MEYRYDVKSIRLGNGVKRHEATFDSDTDAYEYLLSLANDQDCLLAEVQRWPTPLEDSGRPSRVIVVAQAERTHGQWKNVKGELRIRTEGREGHEVLRVALEATGATLHTDSESALGSSVSVS